MCPLNDSIDQAPIGGPSRSPRCEGYVTLQQQKRGGEGGRAGAPLISCRASEILEFGQGFVALGLEIKQVFRRRLLRRVGVPRRAPLALPGLSGLPRLAGLPRLTGPPGLAALPRLAGLLSFAGPPSLAGLLSLAGLPRILTGLPGFAALPRLAMLFSLAGLKLPRLTGLQGFAALPRHACHHTPAGPRL